MDTPNPILHASRAAWDQLITSINPPAMLVAIANMMGERTRQYVSVEDVWQEVLLSAYRDRARCEWRGRAAFRRWLLGIARNRVRDLADHMHALKRGSGHGRTLSEYQSTSDSSADDHYAGPCCTTTPSRAAADREMATVLEQALTAIPEPWCQVVRMRLFEERTLDEIAEQLQIGVEAVRYRFHRGADVYARELKRRRVVSFDAPTPDPG